MHKKTLMCLAIFSLLLSGCAQGDAKSTAASSASEPTADTTVQEDAASSADASADNTTSGKGSASANSSADADKEHPDSLIVYFSLAGEQYDVGNIKKGNTAIVAEMIAEMTGSDTFEIIPVNSYPTDLQSLFDVASREQDENERPDYIGDVENWDTYGTIYIGYPLWFDDMPMIVYHFLEDHDFKGKIIYPFSTCGSEGLLDTVDTIRSICSGADVKDGLSVRGVTVQKDPGSAEQTVKDWLTENGVLQ